MELSTYWHNILVAAHHYSGHAVGVKWSALEVGKGQRHHWSTHWLFLSSNAIYMNLRLDLALDGNFLLVLYDSCLLLRTELWHHLQCQSCLAIYIFWDAGFLPFLVQVLWGQVASIHYAPLPGYRLHEWTALRKYQRVMLHKMRLIGYTCYTVIIMSVQLL